MKPAFFRIAEGCVVRAQIDRASASDPERVTGSQTVFGLMRALSPVTFGVHDQSKALTADAMQQGEGT